MDLSEYTETECVNPWVDRKEIGLEESTTMGDHDTSEIAKVTVDKRAEERDRDRAVNVSALDDTVEILLSIDACIRDFFLPRVRSRRSGSCGLLMDPAVAGSG